MTDEDAMALSPCGYGCDIIGGPFISRNPECPECNRVDKDSEESEHGHVCHE